jgi:hypothetical protein
VEAMRDAMPVLFEMLAEEAEPSVLVVLGHLIFVYIHPYIDGNGRIGRFLMNVMLGAGGYHGRLCRWSAATPTWRPWRGRACGKNISAFADFLGQLVRDGLEGRVIASVPAS